MSLFAGVEEKNATGKVKEIYEDIKATKEIDFVPNFWRALSINPDHLEAVQLFKGKETLFTLHETEWDWIDTIGKQMSAAFGIDMDSIRPDFFLQQGDLSLDDDTKPNLNNGLTFANQEATQPTATTALTDVFKDGTDANASFVDEGSETVGADLTQFSGWTWAAVAGELQ